MFKREFHRPAREEKAKEGRGEKREGSME